MFSNPQVKVKRRGSDKKFIARVLANGTECDIGARGQLAVDVRHAAHAARHSRRRTLRVAVVGTYSRSKGKPG